MTGISLLRQVYSLLGRPERLAGGDGCEDGLLAVNQIYGELWYRENSGEFVPLDSLGQTLELSGRCLPALAYGTAMLLCLAENEGPAYTRYAEQYRRAAACAGGTPRSRLYVQPTEEVTA